MILLNKDIYFLKDLYIVKKINTKRIIKLYNLNTRYIKKRLKMLVDNNYIQVAQRLQNKEYVYSIAKKGLEALGATPLKTKNSNIIYNLAFADFYFHTKINNVFVKLNNYYYFSFNKRRYILNIDILFRSNKWAFVEFDLNNRQLESTFKKIQFYYESNEYKRFFDKFPILLIITNDIELAKFKISKTVNNINIKVKYKTYEEIKNWDYNYSQEQLV